MIFLIISTVISSILSIILFFKIWGMTNDVDNIKSHLKKDGYEPKSKEEAKAIFTLAKLGKTKECEEIIQRQLLKKYFEICEIIKEARDRNAETIYTGTETVHFLTFFSSNYEIDVKYYSQLAYKYGVNIPEELTKLSYSDYEKMQNL